MERGGCFSCLPSLSLGNLIFLHMSIYLSKFPCKIQKKRLKCSKLILTLREAVMTKGNMTQSQLILDALLTRKTLLLSDINSYDFEAHGKEIRIQDSASLMAKLIDPRHCAED